VCSCWQRINGRRVSSRFFLVPMVGHSFLNIYLCHEYIRFFLVVADLWLCPYRSFLKIFLDRGWCYID